MVEPGASASPAWTADRASASRPSFAKAEARKRCAIDIFRLASIDPREASVIKSRNADVEAVVVSAVEGKPMYGGNMLVKPLIKGDEMTFLEIHYAAGVGAQLHAQTHESIAYEIANKG